MTIFMMMMYLSKTSSYSNLNKSNDLYVILDLSRINNQFSEPIIDVINQKIKINNLGKVFIMIIYSLNENMQ